MCAVPTVRSRELPSSIAASPIDRCLAFDREAVLITERVPAFRSDLNLFVARDGLRPLANPAQALRAAASVSAEA